MATKKKIPGAISRWVTSILLLASLIIALYSPGSQWWNNYLHAKALDELSEAVSVMPTIKKEELLESAREWNKALMAGGDTSDYDQQLSLAPGAAAMGRIRIPSINVDLPIYHYSTDAVLRKGAGHMESTSLPIGDETGHAAITAHRGLAESRLFTDIDKVKIGDTFVVNILGDDLYYKVFKYEVVEPTDLNWFSFEQGKDLVTLITCDPIGINSHRILVTGERFYPTLEEEIPPAKTPIPIPFPWFLTWFAGGLSLIIAWHYASFRRMRKRVEAKSLNLNESKSGLETHKKKEGSTPPNPFDS